jgi:transcriptional regulator with XRE-family HTH domain
LYETIKTLCDKRKISVSELERRTGLGNGTISKWKTSSPKLDNLEKVAEELGIKVTTLIAKSKEKE